MCNIISMSLQEALQAEEKEKELRRLIKSLSKVSQKETREIREDIEHEKRLRNRNRVKYQVEADSLLKQKRILHLPNLLFSYRLFESKNKKVESLKQRYIQSQAYLKRANFQYKKIELKKQDIAHKQKKTEEQKYASTPLLLKIVAKPEQDPFQNTQNVPEEVNPALLERFKTTVHSSRKEIKNLYESHIRQVASLPFRRRKESEHFKSQASSVASNLQTDGTPLIKPTKSVILISQKKQKTKKRPLDELIRLSTFRSKEQYEPLTEQTQKEHQEQLRTEGAIIELQSSIQHSNKFKESIVLGQLKKLLYGDRRGRFIQDSTFRTRLRGEHTDQYMKVVQKQQEMLNGFNGSYINRKNLVQKFANILGTLRMHGGPKEVHEFSLI